MAKRATVAAKRATVAAGVQADIDRWGLEGELALKASALSLAETMDDPKTSPAARSQCARALRETLDRLRDLAPVEVRGDGLDEISAARSRRRAASA